ncbi:MAG: polymorphic toxin-type HINT domain-containing protein [Chloroflexota bacterium]
METRHGLKGIDQVRLSDEALAYDERTGRQGYFTVTAVHTHRDEALVRLIPTGTSGEAVETAANHPFLTQDGDWRPAGRLRVGDSLRQSAGRLGRVATVEPRSGSQVMYNLTVAEAHTYFVGAGGWLVHNDCFRGLAAREFDWQHIFDRHAPWGRTAMQRRAAGSDNRTYFEGMNESQIKTTVQRAWRTRENRATQDGGERIVYQGVDPVTRLKIEFIFNKVTRIVETAYPVFR